ncbi:hypothetical protein V6K52_10650 [Knoellia sp. S7-12]|uniref:hypothetical protein n=1 Tax=Knoellia sp. S7-12 TaxID=3126698 RepID=UPI0033685B91
MTTTTETDTASRSPGLRVLGIIWAIALVPAGLFTMLITVFAMSPVQCPDTGGSVLCRTPSTGALGIGIVGILLLAALFTAVGSVNSREKSRQGRLLVISVLLAIAAPALAALGAASWS